MSADNFVAILETKHGDYIVEEMGSEGEKIKEVGKFKNLRKAMIAAEEYQIENEVEYGIRFYPFTL